jgi:tetratricopeptide (TPR) repeat protein
MRILNLRTALGEIAQACEAARRRKRPSPFFFVVGAGISHPPLPLAPKICEDCKAEALRFGRTEEPGTGSSLDAYSHWFARAYPQPIDRQRYLRDLMESAFISRANFRLAHLLLGQSVTNVVATTNFDDLLSRALTLFGKPHIVCDHPNTVERIDLEAEDVQIIHVHGSYWFYDCCNLRHEIEERSRWSPETSVTMPALLDNIFLNRSPLVVGYSGWEGDVIMSAMKRRLTAGLRYNLYWFCYRQEDMAGLPEWLKANSNVSFVLPEATVGPAAAPDGKLGDLHLTQSFQRSKPVLTATTVFDEMIRTFELDPPKLTVDPLGFLAERLQEFLIHDPSVDNDVYAIRGVVERIEAARAKLQGMIPANPAQAQLEALRDAIRRSDYRGAVRQAAKIPLSGLPESHVIEIFSAMMNAGAMLNDGSDEELESYDLTEKLADRLNIKNAGNSHLDQELAATMLKRGITLWRLNRPERAVEAYDAMARRFAGSADQALRLASAMAMLNKGAPLESLGRMEDAISAYESVIYRYPQLREQCPELMARALFNKGVALGSMGRTDEEIATYDELNRRFPAGSDPSVLERVFKGLFNRALALAAAARTTEALAAYDELAKRAGTEADGAFRLWAAKALFNKGVLLAKANHPEQEIAVYDDLVEHFGSATPEQAAKALLNKAIALDALKRWNDQVELCGHILKYCDSLDGGVRDLFAAKALVIKVRAFCRLGSMADADAACGELVGRCGESNDANVKELLEKAKRLRGTPEIAAQSQVLRFDATALYTLREPPA